MKFFQTNAKLAMRIVILKFMIKDYKDVEALTKIELSEYNKRQYIENMIALRLVNL